MGKCNSYMAQPKKIEVGDEFGKWTVIPAPVDDLVYIHVVCVCGKFSRYKAHILRQGLSRQCTECAKLSRATTSGFLSKKAEEKANKKYPPCDPDKEQEMIQEFLKKK